MRGVDWREERSGDDRQIVALGPSDYHARVSVVGNNVSARLWKPHECRDSFVMALHGVTGDDVEAAVDRLKAEIEERFERLEDGHS